MSAVPGQIDLRLSDRALPLIVEREKCHLAYNEEVEARIWGIVSRWKNTDDKKMFGGVCHLLNGNMFCGVYKDFLILRLGEKNS